MVEKEVAVLVVLVRRNRCAVGAAVRRVVDDECFDFRLSGIKGVEVRGSAPVLKEYGKSKSLRALCFSLSRYR